MNVGNWTMSKTVPLKVKRWTAQPGRKGIQHDKKNNSVQPRNSEMSSEKILYQASYRIYRDTVEDKVNKNKKNTSRGIKTISFAQSEIVKHSSVYKIISSFAFLVNIHYTHTPSIWFRNSYIKPTDLFLEGINI